MVGQDFLLLFPPRIHSYLTNEALRVLQTGWLVKRYLYRSYR